MSHGPQMNNLCLITSMSVMSTMSISVLGCKINVLKIIIDVSETSVWFAKTCFESIVGRNQNRQSKFPSRERVNTPPKPKFCSAVVQMSEQCVHAFVCVCVCVCVCARVRACV